MADKETKVDVGGWAIGGGCMLGLGAGFFFLKTSVLAFVGCLVGGIGAGLVLAAVLSAFGRR
jgi:hypothetical protein